MPALSREDAVKLIRRRSPEWTEQQRHWRFLADSFEGGHRYKMADYTAPCDVPRSQSTVFGSSYAGPGTAGYDATTSLPSVLGFGQVSDRNLVPHLSETDPANHDLYALRLARTPVPKKLEMVVRRHLGRIYAREVKRDGPPQLIDWWEDVDGCGTPIDKWMRKTVAPLLCVLGQIDLCFDHPQAEPGLRIETRADSRAAGLEKCIAGYILPENMVWWTLDRTRRYRECLVLERCEDALWFRHWTARDSTLYDEKGNVVEIGGAPQVIEHRFGRVPIVRVFDDRKPRCENVGQPRYVAVADYQKCIYNALSEQILADIQQANPLLQGPEDYVQGEDTITVGPANVLPMKKTPNGDGYQEWSYVECPQGQAAERRTHILDYGEEIDRSAALTKPAGATGTGAGTVAQSGISKSFDNQEGSDYLAEVSATLEDAETTAAEYVLLVLGDGKVDPSAVDSLVITYPREFDLVSGDDLAGNLTDMQGLASGAGTMPETSKEYMKRKLRVDLPGLDEEKRMELEKEIEELCDQSATDREQIKEGMMATDPDAATPNTDYGMALTSLSGASN